MGENAPGQAVEPIPDAPLDINKLLNPVNEAFINLLTVLETLGSDDPHITETICSQDAMSENVRVLAAGLAQKLPRSYKLAMKSDEASLWGAACDKEITMLRGMGVWKKFLCQQESVQYQANGCSVRKTIQMEFTSNIRHDLW